jgi:hypothetical protein
MEYETFSHPDNQERELNAIIFRLLDFAECRRKYYEALL